MLNHAIGINAEAGLSLGRRLQVRKNVHAGGIPPDEERLSIFVRLVHESESGLRDFFVHGFHALFCQRTGVFNLLLAVRHGPGMNHAARTELLFERGAFRIIGIFRFLFGIQVIKVAEEFVEAMGRRQHLVAVTKVVLAKLTRCIAQGLEQGSDGRVFRLHAFRCPGQANLGQAGPYR